MHLSVRKAVIRAPASSSSVLVLLVLVRAAEEVSMELVQQSGGENFRDAGGAGCTVMLDTVDSFRSAFVAESHGLSTPAIVTQGLSTPAAVTCVTENDGMMTIVGSSDGKRSLKMTVDRSTPFVYTVRMDHNSAKRLQSLYGTYFDIKTLRRDFVSALREAQLLPESLEFCDEQFAIGYIRPGHGAKGQKVELADENDLATMYAVCRVRQDIMLWYSVAKEVVRPAGVYLPRGKGRGTSMMTWNPPIRPKKRAKVESEPPPKPEPAALTPKKSVGPAISHVEVDLTPQIAATAAAVVNWPTPGIGDVTPRTGESLAIGVSSNPVVRPTSAAVTGGSMTSSPLPATLERAGARKTLIEQLRMWFDLYNAGAVLLTDYEHHRQKILQDMDNL